MDKKAAPTTGKSNIGWIIGGVIALAIAVIYFATNGSSNNSTVASTDPMDADAKAKAAAEAAAKAKAEADAKAKADAEAKEKDEKELLNNPPKYKRPGDAINVDWKVPNKVDLDYYVRTMRQTGWSDELISYGAAWMKGMSLPINTHWANTQIKSIRDFMKKFPYIKRNPDFATEIQNYPFFPGELVDDEHATFGRLRFNR